MKSSVSLPLSALCTACTHVWFVRKKKRGSILEETSLRGKRQEARSSTALYIDIWTFTQQQAPRREWLAASISAVQRIDYLRYVLLRNFTAGSSQPRSLNAYE
ncbi:hypothetical protein F5B17DRAFT_427411 [Nemania serpens]|nr:hypothetical protein F5B17DRAFT_427411 [Nemania serpens]